MAEKIEFSYISSNRFLQRCGLKTPELEPVAGTLYYIFEGKSFKTENPYLLKDKATGKNIKLKEGQVWIYKENPKKKGTMCWYLFSRSNQELEVENGTHALLLN